MSLDGLPVIPVRDEAGMWVSPVTGAEVVQLPDGTWTFAMRETLATLGMDLDQHVAEVAAHRAAGRW